MQAPTTKTFRFTVDDNGKFLYDPDGDWAYTRRNTLEFRTTSGPFTLHFEPVQAPGIPGFAPLGGPLTGEPDGEGGWVATTRVNDGLTDAYRNAIREANRPAEGGEGFVARYQYVIDGKTPEGVPFHAHDHNGIFVC
jgi:hypothetical protein